MIITDIKEGKSLYALYIDGEYVSMICKDSILTYNIKKGESIDDYLLHSLLEYSDYVRAKEKALNLLTYRDCSEKEMYNKLRLKFNENACRKAVEKLKELNLIDDRRFAQRYANELISNKKLSLRGVRSELYKKGIDRDLTDEILEEFDIDPVEQITELIERKFLRNLSDEKGIKRVYNTLLRMGYSYSDIRSALNEYISEKLEEDFL